MATMFTRSFRPASSISRQAFANQIRPARGTSQILSQTRAQFFHHAPPRFGTFAPKAQSISPFWRATGVTVVGLGLTASVSQRQQTYCDTAVPAHGRARPVASDSLPPPPQSSVSTYELTFGSVCGLCAGIFIKKGAKALAFILGGVFVLLQYLGSQSIVRVDWARAAGRFENLFYTARKDPVTGVETRSAPNVLSMWRWIVNFLTADFQQRASFVAGLALGLRVG